MKRTQVYYFAKGHLGQYENWWYLVENDDGTFEVEHEWDDVSINGSSGHSEGSVKYSLDQGLKKAPQGAVDKIKEMLGIFG